MENAARKEIIQKISDELNEAMRVSSKIFAVDHIFVSESPLDDITITSDEADGIHIILDEVARQIGNSLLDALQLVNQLEGEV